MKHVTHVGDARGIPGRDICVENRFVLESVRKIRNLFDIPVRHRPKVCSKKTVCDAFAVYRRFRQTGCDGIVNCRITKRGWRRSYLARS